MDVRYPPVATKFGLAPKCRDGPDTARESLIRGAHVFGSVPTRMVRSSDVRAGALGL
jgi:hypothetical protein